MLVYGDASRLLAPGEAIASVRAALDRAATASGLARHEALVEALIEAGAVAQAVADARFAARGEVDDADPDSEAALRLARATASCVVASWCAGFASAGPLVEADKTLDALARRDLPNRLALREPEGFAHYAVYPEAFAAAVGAIPDGPLCVVGLRSIGTTLAAIVAAARPDVPLALTVRPVGHPFRREVRLGAALRERIAATAGWRFAIVDEGPGLSGSSVAAAVVALEGAGVSPGRIHVLPSHGGEPGREADAAVRSAWRRVQRHAVTAEEGVLGRLADWCADLVGEPCRPLREVSGGVWREALSPPEDAWPPVLPWQEKRKFLLSTRSGTWLLRFAGLGRIGRKKLDLSRRLGSFVPEVAGLRHGFLVERWHGNARPLRADHPDLPVRLAAYLAHRATLAVPSGRAGAAVPELYGMLLHNAGESLGPAVRDAFATRWEPRLARLAAHVRPVLTDNRLQAWEWIETAGGLLKTDAVDHHAGHDLVGAQDIAWDVAGATIEYGFGRAQVAELAAAVERGSGRAVDPDLLGFMEAAYAAFHLGRWTLAGDVPGETERIDQERQRYRVALASCVPSREGRTGG